MDVCSDTVCSTVCNHVSKQWVWVLLRLGVEFQVVVHLHLVGVVVDTDASEAHLELRDRDVDVAVFMIVDVGNLRNHFRVLGLWTGRAVLAFVAILAPWVTSFD